MTMLSALAIVAAHLIGATPCAYLIVRWRKGIDIRTVGWYRFGPGPGATTGSAVLSGHVDDRDQGYGAFHRLGDLAPGDPIAVDLADGGVVSYRVEAVTRVPKGDLPVGEVFARTGAPRLTLVTCGGPFDDDAHAYTENVVVVARPDAP